jgi:L-threonylcarbamoyladenylate synthase
MDVSKEQLEKAIEILKQGGVVVFPTETAYGLAADATNQNAVDKVCQIKGRVPETLPTIAATVDMAESMGVIPKKLRELSDQYWPGPLTIVIPAARGSLAPGIVNNDMIAVRVSSHPVAQALSAGLGAPIVSTSANVSGQPTGYAIEDVQAQFDGREHQPDMYLDMGPLDASVKPSTIVTVDDYGYPEVLRDGSIDLGL